MDNFSRFVEYCKRSDGGESLQRFLLIWDEKYPSMIRRSLAMTLKEKLEHLPKKDETVDLKALIEVINKKVNDLHTVVMTKPKPKAKELKTKKPTKKEKLAMILEKRAFLNVTKSN
jgi:hypothetical protein